MRWYVWFGFAWAAGIAYAFYSSTGNPWVAVMALLIGGAAVLIDEPLTADKGKEEEHG